MNEDTLVFRRYDFSPKKPFKNTGLLFEQLYKLAAPFICDQSHNFLYLEDLGYGKISPTERILKRFPSLARHGFISGQKKGLTNLDNRWDQISKSTENVDYNTLALIANGIPRAYPFNYATFILNYLNWRLHGNIELKSCFNKEMMKPGTGNWQFHSPCLMLFSNSYVGARDIWFSFIFNFHGSRLQDKQERFKEFSEILSSVNQFGRHLRTGTFICHSESQNTLAKEKLAALETLFSTKRDAIIEHYLSDAEYQKAEVVENRDIDDGVHLIPLLKNELKKIGYKIAGKKQVFGEYDIIKKTGSNNYIYIELLVSSMSTVVDIIFHIKSFNVEAKVEYPIIINQEGKIIRPVLYSRKMLQSFRNKLVVALKYFDTALLSEVDEICGKSPDWFEAF